jgi:lysophospholipase L1-like esterase
MLGTNDAGFNNHVPVATYKSNLQSTISALGAAGFQRILLNIPPYIQIGDGTYDTAASNALIVQYQDALRDLAAVDPTHVFLGDQTAYGYYRLHPELYQPDGVHLSVAGNQSLGRIWSRAFDAVFECAPEDKRTPRRIMGCSKQ